MIYEMILPVPNGTELKFSAICLNVTNTQQMQVLGIDFDNLKMEFGDTDLGDGYKSVSEPVGKLNDAHFHIRSRVTNSLNRFDWDWITYPNPELVLVTKMKL